MGNELMDGIWGSGLGVSLEVQEVGRRVAQCSESAEGVLSGFQDIQLLDWQSPAGQAYRDSVALQAVAVRRALDRVREASAAVAAHARAALTSECSPDGRF
ncbi:hypothetical protein [Arthrobacter sp. FW306-06-A]|uniref:hypothetical protein n=1 Tax=Arthrobacter sp. FW306-06-A TaxID=2879621 RepID=UPI001F29D778|nr:hypothetical protein [Arthrobacter sp. FW306-06-A]UKA71059.1 hypothetical protein LFT49_20515 [Arthrobacter sp. FW306-06-A]